MPHKGKMFVRSDCFAVGATCLAANKVKWMTSYIETVLVVYPRRYFLTDAEVKAYIKKKNIQLISYKDLLKQ